MARTTAQSRGQGGEINDFDIGLKSKGGMSPLRRLQHPPIMGRSGGLAPSSPMGMALRKKKMSRQSHGGGQLQLQTSLLDGAAGGNPGQAPEGNLRSERVSPKFRQSLQLDD